MVVCGCSVWSTSCEGVVMEPAEWVKNTNPQWSKRCACPKCEFIPLGPPPPEFPDLGVGVMVFSPDPLTCGNCGETFMCAPE